MQSLPRKIRVSIAAQRLDLLEISSVGDEQIRASFPVSTSGFGLGSEPGSHRTPLGRFAVGEKIGAGAPLGTVFVSREPTGERYIYIHGTNHEERLGDPCSHGCVRMRNADIAELFEDVEPGMEVTIEASPAV